jgi:hypothetical protein
MQTVAGHRTHDQDWRLACSAVAIAATIGFDRVTKYIAVTTLAGTPRPTKHRPGLDANRCGIARNNG